MNQLMPIEQKMVSFNGSQILGVKADDGNIYIGVSWICNGIRLTESQKDRQVRNIQEDIVLSKGAKKLPLKFDGQVREVLTLELNFLPLWLAKITITPNMKQHQPETTENLVEYQLKSKDVLAEAFVKKQTNFNVPQSLPEALRLAADLAEHNDRLQLENSQKDKMIEEQKPKVIFAESLQISKDSILVGELAKILKQNGIDIGGTRLFQVLRDEGYLIKRKGSEYNLPTQKSMELKIMEIKVGSRQGSDGTAKTTHTPKINGKGQLYFINKFKSGEISYLGVAN